LVMPAYAEVTSLKTDKTFYKKGEKITFSGTLEPSDTNAIVSIRVKDSHDTLAVFRQTFSDADQNFKLDIDTSNRDFHFDTHGIYTATAFLNDLAKGVEVNFDFSLDGSPVSHPEEPATTTQPPPTSSSTSGTTNTPQTGDDSEKSIEEKIQERIEAAKKQGSQTTGTTDSEKSIEEKIQERIEAAKKQESQDKTTDSTGGVKPTGNTTIPKEVPDTSNTNNENNIDSNVLYIVIGLGAALAVGVAVYGMKYKPKHMTDYAWDDASEKQIQHPDSQTIHEEDYALMILKNRLAKGEITIEEYDKLKRALKES